MSCLVPCSQIVKCDNMVCKVYFMEKVLGMYFMYKLRLSKKLKL